jgi:hypothetical protein
VRVTKEIQLIKKFTKAYNSSMCRHTPSGGIPMKFGTFGDLAEVINPTKFHVDWSRGLGFTEGRKTHVPIGKASRS